MSARASSSNSPQLRLKTASTKHYDVPLQYKTPLPFPSQWITVVSVANDDMKTCIRQTSGLRLSQARFLIETNYQRHKNRIGEIGSALMLQPNTCTAIEQKLIGLGLIEELQIDETNALGLQCTELATEALSEVDDGLRLYRSLLEKVLDRKQLAVLLKLLQSHALSLNAGYERSDSRLDKDMPIDMYNYLSGSALLLTQITRASRKQGLSLIEARLLITLAAYRQPARITTLGNRLGLRSNVVSITAKSLFAQGLIIKQDDPDDRRAIRISLSQDSDQLLLGLCGEIADFFPTSDKALANVPLSVTSQLYRAEGV